nr:protocadherin cluster 1 gamma 18a [Danio rerio]
MESGGKGWRYGSLFFYTLCAMALFSSRVSGQIRYSIPEEMQVGSFVGNIALDLGFEPKRLVSGKARVFTADSSEYIGLDKENGHLVIKNKIDREELCGEISACSQKPPNTDWRFPPNQRPGPSGQHRFHTLQQRWTPYEKSRAGARPEEAGAGAGVIAGTGPWPNPPTEAEQLQAMMAAANASEATATLGPRYNLQYGPDYRQNVYIPGSTATLTANPQQQVLQQALPPPQALPPTEVPKAAQTPASKKKPTKKDKK